MKLKENILIGDSIYIIGHKTPDCDAIVSAHAYQVYRHSQGDFNYIAVRCDEPNEVTKWIYSRWNLTMPDYVADVSGKKIVLVDHTDPEQRPNGWENAEIIEVVDHHKIKLETSAPPKITVRPHGSTTTIVAQKMFRAGIKIDQSIAGIMLSAVLDDTLALRSPITTFIDKQMAGLLAAQSGITNLSDYAREQFGQKDVWHKLSAGQVCKMDSKLYEMGGIKVRVAQVETMDNRRLESKVPSYYNFMKGDRIAEKTDVSLLMISDLIRNECSMVVATEDKYVADLEKMFGAKVESNMIMHLPGVVSRKKQVIPVIDLYWKGNNS